MKEMLSTIILNIHDLCNRLFLLWFSSALAWWPHNISGDRVGACEEPRTAQKIMWLGVCGEDISDAERR